MKEKLIPAFLTGMIAMGVSDVKADNIDHTDLKNATLTEHAVKLNKGWEINSYAQGVTNYVTTNGIKVSGPSMQGEVEIKSPDKYYAKIWGSKTINARKGHLTTNEVDFTFGKITELPHGLYIDLGLSDYYISQDFKDNRNDFNLLHPFVILSRPFMNAFGTTTPTIEVNANLSLDESNISNCYNSESGVIHEFPKIRKTTLAVSGTIFRNMGCARGDGYKAGGTASWKISEVDTLSVGIMSYSPNKSEDVIAGGIRLKRTF